MRESEREATSESSSLFWVCRSVSSEVVELHTFLMRTSEDFVADAIFLALAVLY